MGLDWVELLMEIEDEFGIEIPNREAGELGTVGLLAQCVARHLRKEQRMRLSDRGRDCR